MVGKYPAPGLFPIYLSVKICTCLPGSGTRCYNVAAMPVFPVGVESREKVRASVRLLWDLGVGVFN